MAIPAINFANCETVMFSNIFTQANMRKFYLRFPLAVLLLAAIFPAQAARISEPDTIFYGRIIQRVGTREFLATTGQLIFKLKTAGPAAGERQFRDNCNRSPGDSFPIRFAFRTNCSHMT